MNWCQALLICVCPFWDFRWCMLLLMCLSMNFCENLFGIFFPIVVKCQNNQKSGKLDFLSKIEKLESVWVTAEWRLWWLCMNYMTDCTADYVRTTYKMYGGLHRWYKQRFLRRWVVGRIKAISTVFASGASLLISEQFWYQWLICCLCAIFE